MPRKTKDAAAAESIALLDGRVSRQAEKYPAWLAELAELDAALLREREGTALPLLTQLGKSFFSPTLHNGHLPEHRAALMRAVGGLRAAFFPEYSRALCVGAGLTPSDFLPITALSGSRIAYVKNAYADEAYEILAETLPSPTAAYADSFRTACEEVVSGDADLCILPYENAGGLLASFAALAERYALVCVATCRVFHADGTDVTHFALYRPCFLPINEKKACHLRYAFPFTGAGRLAAHIAALDAFDAKIERLICEADAESGSIRCALTLTLYKNTLTPWLTYLSLFAEGYVVQGLYEETEA